MKEQETVFRSWCWVVHFLVHEYYNGGIRIVHSYRMVRYIEFSIQVYIGEEIRKINGENF